MEENKKRGFSKAVILSIVILLLLLAAMVFMAAKHLVGTIVYPIVIIVFMSAYWIVTDVLDVIWEKQLEGKTPEQIKAYYTYAACDLAGLAGLVWFLVDMRSMTGVIIYVLATFMKRKYNDEFKGYTDEDEEESASEEAAEADVTTEASEEDTTPEE